MAEEDTNAENTEEGSEEEQSPAKKKISGKTIVLFGGPIILLLIGGLVFFLMSSGGDEDEIALEEQKALEAEQLSHNVVFYELPSMLVNLNSNGGSARYLKLKVSIELEDEAAIAVIEPLLPRIVDRFQVYLRELRVSELSGSAGMFHLKQELLRRINLAVPVPVKDVLFTEMILQ